MANRKVSGMDLSPALARLRAHAAPGLDPHEAAMVEDAVSFIGSHPECLWRRCLDGHLTGSAWIVSADRAWTLLTHHHKLDKWLQVGGHADGDGDLLRDGHSHRAVHLALHHHGHVVGHGDLHNLNEEAPGNE